MKKLRLNPAEFFLFSYKISWVYSKFSARYQINKTAGPDNRRRSCLKLVELRGIEPLTS